MSVSVPIKSSDFRVSSSDARKEAKREWLCRGAAVLCGVVAGFGAPGFEQWYLPWLVMGLMLVIAADGRRPWDAGVRGYFFGLGYNLVYLSWLTAFRQVYADGNFVVLPSLINISFWLILSAWQGLIVSVFFCFLKAIPMVGGWLPAKKDGVWHLPSFLVLPFLWVLVERLCHTTQLLGFPWTALQNTQYKQLVLIQLASIAGGGGVAAWILLVGANVAAFLCFGRERLSQLTLPSRKALLFNTSLTILLSISFYSYGSSRLAFEQASLARKPKVTVSALQSGVSEKVHHISVQDMLARYLKLVSLSPRQSLCIWPEWSIPINFSSAKDTLRLASRLSLNFKQSWVIGLFDTDAYNRLFNSVAAISENGKVLSEVYHKRYLVPVGEFTPDWIRETLISILLYGFNKRYHDNSSGEEPTVFDVGKVKVAPVLCFENAIPKICADSVRKGAEILSDSSDTSWFRNSNLSDQMVSFCVMRAVENHRSFVFATALGPSTIVDSSGHILRQAPREAAATISCEVPIERELTIFTRYCF